eukprot:COSAG02_NODE_2728_length_8148_cov_19.461921_4_plen_89_part_00
METERQCDIVGRWADGTHHPLARKIPLGIWQGSRNARTVHRQGSIQTLSTKHACSLFLPISTLAVPEAHQFRKWFATAARATKSTGPD